MYKEIKIDPITRLEGHGKIEIFLDDKGEVAHACLQIPELRGYERFAIGRLAEEMPRITETICGVCPTAHHTCSGKTLDNLYGVEPPPAARKIREFVYNAFMFEDHNLHFYFLGGPDFIVGPDAPKEKRNVLGVIEKVGLEIGKKVIDIRKRTRNIIQTMGGRVVHPVHCLPGGVSKPMDKEIQEEFKKTAQDAVEFAKFSLQVFDDIVLKNKAYVDLILSDTYTHKTYYMGLVDDNNKVNFYDGWIRVVDPEGKEFARFKVQDYLDHIAEHVETWSYIKYPYLKNVGWKDFVDGKDSGVYRVAPLGRLNASDGMATPLAQEHYEKFYDTLGGKPVHYTLATHWARLIEALQAAERMVELINDPEIMDPDIRNMDFQTPKKGIGVIEAPRGTLIHHYETDENGRLTKANLIVATVNNSAAINMSIAKAAKGLIKGDNANDGILNMIEMAFRAYDPCLACATHTINGYTPLEVDIFDHKHRFIKKLRTY
ncbi:Ni/Fe hydrogenase subunit alpha [candidate division WOR-3 bacterium 4484_100]|uniref:Ni/Fe hydrogenase subunit alpha n=1 Tax=candidate division WOR-3 bacterium 4484_100 TaxID=1936077 RepID=A0A1V4QGG4_UNCW3|nr:MAG: Ni/Fe hydrogenase subunit alpha [candidate division WOR-3 bacterium 4484_100]